jgi:hypothetical protein
MAYEPSNDLLEKVKAQAAARRRHRRKTAAQIIGGSAEALRTGQSAVDTFAKRAPDYSGTYRTPEQKRAEIAPLQQQLAKSEQFYYKQALEDAQFYAKQRQQAVADMLRASVQTRGQDVTASTARARERGKAQALELARKEKQLNSLTETNKATSHKVGEAEEYIRGLAVATFGQMTDEDGAPRRATREEQERAVAIFLDTPAGQEKVAQAAQGLLQDPDPGQAAAGLQSLAVTLGRDIKDLAGADDALAQKIDEAHLAVYDQHRTLTQEIEQDTANMLNVRVGAGNAAVDEAAQRVQGVMEENATRRAQVRLPAAAGGVSATEAAEGPEAAGVAMGQTQLDVGEAQGMPGAGEPSPEGAPTEDPTQYYFGDPSLGRVATSAEQRTLDQIELINSRPELPPVQQLKSEILSSADFQEFKAKRNYPDDEVALKALRQTMRQNKANLRRQSMEQLRNDRRSGLLGNQARAKQRLKKESTPVQGSVNRTPAEVKSGGPTRSTGVDEEGGGTK